MRVSSAAERAGATSQNRSSSGHSRSHVHAVCSLSHIEKSPLAPHDPAGIRIAARSGCRSRCCDPVLRPDLGSPAQLRGRRSPRKSGPSNHQCPKSSVSNGATTTPSRRWLSAVADRAEEAGEMVGVSARPVARGGGIVRLLVSEVHVGPAHPPELEAAGPAHLVELEVSAVAGVTPCRLHTCIDAVGRARGGDVARAAAMGDAVCLIGSALSRGRPPRGAGADGLGVEGRGRPTAPTGARPPRGAHRRRRNGIPRRPDAPRCRVARRFAGRSATVPRARAAGRRTPEASIPTARARTAAGAPPCPPRAAGGCSRRGPAAAGSRAWPRSLMISSRPAPEGAGTRRRGCHPSPGKQAQAHESLAPVVDQRQQWVSPVGSATPAPRHRRPIADRRTPPAPCTKRRARQLVRQHRA